MYLFILVSNTISILYMLDDVRLTVTRGVSLVEQELFTLQEHLSSLLFLWGLCCTIFSFLSLNIFYLHKSCKWDWTQVMTTLVKFFPF